MRLNLRTLINFLAVLVVFSDAYSSRALTQLFELRGSYFLLPIVISFCLILAGRFYFSKNFIVVFGIISLVSIYAIFTQSTTIVSVSKAIISILLNALTFYMVLKVNDFNVKYIFIIYLNIAVLVSLIGIAQEINNIFKIMPEFGLTLPLRELPLYRITSIFPEPAHYCEAMTPAFFASFASLLQKTELIRRWKAVIILLSFLFTFSTVGYFGVFISIILIILLYNKYKYLLIGAIIIPLFIFIAYYKMYEVKLRVDGTFNVITGKTKLLNTNWSTFALISNWEIGFISFKENPLFGNGLGSHPVSYRKNINKVLGQDMEILEKTGHIMPLNVEDAGSLFNRLLSETGLFGLLAFLIFLLRGHVSRKYDKSNYLWIINNAILVFFIIKLLRGGHYFIYGVFLFFWIYYFSMLIYESDQIQSEDIIGDGQ